MTKCYEQNGDLYVYATGEYLREATTEEAAASATVAELDGGSGVIEVDAEVVPCLVGNI